MKWNSLFNSGFEPRTGNHPAPGELKNRTREKLEEIAGVLSSRELLDPSAKRTGLLDGRTGIALFFFYYAALTHRQEHMDYAFDILASVLGEIDDTEFLQGHNTFDTGLSGIGWMVEHLVQNRLLEASTNAILAELDEFLYNNMIHDLQNAHYDYLHGAMGSGLYFLNRRSLPSSEDYLAHLVEGLEKLSLPDKKGGLKWECHMDYKTGKKGFGISLAHGVAGIVVVLAKILDQGIHRQARNPHSSREVNLKINYLLEGAVKYLLNQRLDTIDGEYLSCFPRWSLESAPAAHSRLAWCYGDLGIAAALWQASQVTQNKEWEKISLEVFTHSTQRRDLELNRVQDTGLCHGSAGIAHIYNRMYHYTGREIFYTSTLYWLNETLNMAHFQDGYAGFKTRYGDNFVGFKNNGGLLDGVAGIGLVFISMMSNIEPKWDRCLLLS